MYLIPKMYEKKTITNLKYFELFLFFLRRQRNYKPEVSSFLVKFDTLKIENGHLSAEVLNTKNTILFVIDLFLLKDNTFRFKFNELSPLRKRYEVQDVIIDDLQQEK